jgi:CPA2 family monovalent cation:H+ antiporter-2
MSVALGAFFAGLVVGQSRIGPQAAADMAPFRDVFSALFFVSIGMLFDPTVLTEDPALLAFALAIVLVVKPVAALLIVVLLRDTLRTALTVAVGLAQIGEFSFILAALGNSLGVLPAEGTNVLVATAIVSIALNPLLFRLLPAIEERFGARWQRGERKAEEAQLDTPPQSDEAAPAVVITGLGELGRRLVRRSIAAGTPVCVVDDNLERLETFQTMGVATVFGDPAREQVLEAAHIAAARVVVVTNASLALKMRICSLARRLNPRISIIATAESEAERAWLREFGVAYVADVYDEMSDSLARAVRRVL